MFGKLKKAAKKVKQRLTIGDTDPEVVEAYRQAQRQGRLERARREGYATGIGAKKKRRGASVGGIFDMITTAGKNINRNIERSYSGGTVLDLGGGVSGTRKKRKSKRKKKRKRKVVVYV
jgi:hypothetical protein